MPRIRDFRWGAWAYWAVENIERDTPATVAIDTETTGLGYYDEAFCATLTWKTQTGDYRSAYIDLDGPDSDAGRAYRTALLGRALRGVPCWVFHNAKFDLQKLVLCGAITQDDIDRAELHDTQTIFHLLNENERKGLKYLARTVLGEETNEETTLAKVRRKLGLKKADGYYHIPREYIVRYALKDTEFTLRLFEVGVARLGSLGGEYDSAVWALYRREIELKKALLRMMDNGFKLDLDYLDKTTSEYGAKVMEGWQRVVQITGKPDLNPQSPKQLTEVFAERGVFVDSTAENVLKTLDDELAQAIIAYRSDKKMHTTYLKALQTEQRNGLVHPWFNEDGARTGRMSSSAASN